jgi:stage II sporulation protein AA (anti-sigma F factor antagonist)
MKINITSENGTAVAVLNGEIDHHSAGNIRDGIDKMIANLRPQTLILDLSEIEFMDSSGLGLVLGRYRRIRELGGDMFLCNTNDRIMKILKMAGVDRIIKNVNSERFLSTDDGN